MLAYDFPLVSEIRRGTCFSLSSRRRARLANAGLPPSDNLKPCPTSNSQIDPVELQIAGTPIPVGKVGPAMSAGAIAFGPK